ncbi:hypothetical protein [Cryobacterium sp. TMT4-31]|uniref:hypothetical protein n=1 Tax=Cryobacterium sp. TMT4-31 TaxID=1259259 RepID=UPI001069C86C|nr:hypothetical protein [Cryobacterium sp. TMT4-31]TFC86381.1 hypothetical protein E3T19_15495 [Cryobacterium sp. TMT4-31]
MAAHVVEPHAEWHVVRFLNCAVSPSQLKASLGLTGLVAEEPLGPGVQLVTGVAAGPVTITLNSLPAAPARLETGWEDIAEFSVEVRDGPLQLLGHFDAPEASAPRLDEQGAGTYRIRVYGRGRDTAYDATVSEPTEEYIIISWLALAAAPQTIAAGSTMSAGWIESTRHHLERGTTWKVETGGPAEAGQAAREQRSRAESSLRAAAAKNTAPRPPDETPPK